MTQLESLTAFIRQHMPPRAMQMFRSSMDNCELTPAAKSLGMDQRQIGYVRYDVVLGWDDFPYRICSPAIVYALVLIWIEEHANELHDTLKLAAPGIDPEFIDESTAMIEITVPVADQIILRQTEGGMVPSKGRQWDVVYPEIWTAEEGEVIPRREDDT